MKLLVSTLALAVLAASPALAAAPKHVDHRTAVMSSDAATSYAAQQDSDNVIVGGQIVGRDPDPNVRLELMKDTGLQAP
jgi:hypothetical protein